jgi:hypothetical protein
VYQSIARTPFHNTHETFFLSFFFKNFNPMGGETKGHETSFTTLDPSRDARKKKEKVKSHGCCERVPWLLVHAQIYAAAMAIVACHWVPLHPHTHPPTSFYKSSPGVSVM